MCIYYNLCLPGFSYTVLAYASKRWEFCLCDRSVSPISEQLKYIVGVQHVSRKLNERMNRQPLNVCVRLFACTRIRNKCIMRTRKRMLD